jgi:hypothetical protein
MLSAVLGAAACSGIATAPSEPAAQAPAYGLVGNLLSAVLLKCSPLPATSDTRQIGSAGGVLVIGPHMLVIPAGALSQNTTIRGEVVSGSVNSGTLLSRGAQVQPERRPDHELPELLRSRNAAAQKDCLYRRGLNLLSILQSLDLSGQKLVTAPLEHFSRYAVAY